MPTIKGINKHIIKFNNNNWFLKLWTLISVGLPTSNKEIRSFGDTDAEPTAPY